MTLGVRATGNGASRDAALAGAISAAIANQIRACWSPPKTLGDDVSLTADRRILVATFSPNGELSTIPTVYVVHDDHQTEVSEPDMIESAAIAALERCAPIKLPSPLYSYWQQVELELFPKSPMPELARADA
jgi:colicin import membrane protein